MKRGKLCSFENKCQNVVIEYEYSGGLYFWIASNGYRSYQYYRIEDIINDAKELYGKCKNFKILADTK